MDLVRLYGRALGMLAAEKSLAVALALASVAIGVVQLAEPILFGRVVDALSRGEGAFPTIALWAALGCSEYYRASSWPCMPIAWPIAVILPLWRTPSSAP